MGDSETLATAMCAGMTPARVLETNWDGRAPTWPDLFGSVDVQTSLVRLQSSPELMPPMSDSIRRATASLGNIPDLVGAMRTLMVPMPGGT